jgi:hypothetical protein
MRAGNYLAVMCLFFGAALAAFVSGSLEPRLGNLFVFGVMPAVGFSAGGYVLGHLLVFGVKAGDTIMVRCFQYMAQLANALINWAYATVPNWVAVNLHGKPNAAGPFNGDELGVNVRRGWRLWSLITAAVSLTAVGLGCLVTTPLIGNFTLNTKRGPVQRLFTPWWSKSSALIRPRSKRKEQAI